VSLSFAVNVKAKLAFRILGREVYFSGRGIDSLCDERTGDQFFHLGQHLVFGGRTTLWSAMLMGSLRCYRRRQAVDQALVNNSDALPHLLHSERGYRS